MHSQVEEWSSRWVFFMAATATAVGLGNIWKFPFIVAQNGGGAFIALYLLCVMLIAVPLMLSEVVLGYLGKSDPVRSVRHTADASGASRLWACIGLLGPLAGLLIITLLTVVSAWAISYFFAVLDGEFVDASHQVISDKFDWVKSDSQSLLFYQSAFLLCVASILGMNVNRGLKRALLFLVPSSIALLLILIAQAFNSGDTRATYDILFTPMPEKLGLQALLLALEHAFYTLSVGIGALLVFGAYMPKRSSVGLIVIGVAMLDTLIALLAGFVVVPPLLASGLPMSTGFDLLFVALPFAHGDMTDGVFLGSVFFLFVIMMAFSSALVLLEPAVAWCAKSLSMGRTSAAIVVVFNVWLLAMACWGAWNITFVEHSLFALLNGLSANVLLPLSALCIALYTGWVLKPNIVRQRIEHSGVAALYLWYFLLRYLVPPALLYILVARLV
ncbi:MAG: sodium-dependent transporter [Pseudomonadales bacterium]